MSFLAGSLLYNLHFDKEELPAPNCQAVEQVRGIKDQPAAMHQAVIFPSLDSIQHDVHIIAMLCAIGHVFAVGTKNQLVNEFVFPPRQVVNDQTPFAASCLLQSPLTPPSICAPRTPT